MTVFQEWLNHTLQSDFMRKMAGLSPVPSALVGLEVRLVGDALECAARRVRMELKRLNYIEGPDEPEFEDWAIAIAVVSAFMQKRRQQKRNV